MLEDKEGTIKRKETEIKILEKEKDEKSNQLDKYKSGASVEMKDLQNKISGLESERRKLLLQVNELERSKDEAHTALQNQKGEQGDIEISLRNRISDLEEENRMIKSSFEQELNAERGKQEDLKKLINDLKAEREKLLKEKQKSEDQTMKVRKNLNDFLSFKDTVVLTIK